MPGKSFTSAESSVGNVDHASVCSDLQQKTDFHPVEQREVDIAGGSVPHKNEDNVMSK